MQRVLASSLIPAATCLVLAAGLLGCSSGQPTQAETEKQPAASAWPEPADEALIAGKAIWEADCQICHKDGLGEAPVVTRADLWESRIAQGRETLYAHAIEGFFGSTGEEMPARGGNENLTGEQVKAAVDYQLWIIEALKE